HGQCHYGAGVSTLFMVARRAIQGKALSCRVLASLDLLVEAKDFLPPDVAMQCQRVRSRRLRILYAPFTQNLCAFVSNDPGSRSCVPQRCTLSMEVFYRHDS